MVDRIEKIQCNGCKMCKDICPVKAISYNVDIEGFWYPKVNSEKCISCGLCINKCPNLNKKQSRMKYPDVKAAWSLDNKIRLASTSGGIFFELAKYVLENNGYVAGCVYTDDYKSAKHILIHTMDELPPLMVSKYLQSDTENIYKKIKEVLISEKSVLFVGAPCHCSALDAYLGKDYKNLILCDFICRGANSPKAHKKYVEYLEKQYGAEIVSLRSKDKRNGWNKFGQSAVFKNGMEYFGDRNTDLRILAYHHGNLMMRQSCNACQFKNIPRDADLTLGDFWGVEQNQISNLEMGVSLVMLNSEKGKMLFEKIRHRIGYIDKTLKDAEKGNPAIYQSAPKGKNRDKFLYNLDVLPFDKLVERYKDKPKPNFVQLYEKYKRFIKKLVSHI